MMCDRGPGHIFSCLKTECDFSRIRPSKMTMTRLTNDKVIVIVILLLDLDLSLMRFVIFFESGGKILSLRVSIQNLQMCFYL